MPSQSLCLFERRFVGKSGTPVDGIFISPGSPPSPPVAHEGIRNPSHFQISLFTALILISNKFISCKLDSVRKLK